jgi:Peptide N-acetyl-beta-D-glucosaminyl asparaginase amidase A
VGNLAYCPLPRVLTVFAVSGVILFANNAVKAQVAITPSSPQIGSSNPVSPEPSVPRPRHSKPCTVQLFQNLEFADFNIKPFTYTPPSDCPGPWEKVVFSADFTVTAGRQFDRTAKFFLGGVNLYFGTTAEPRATLSPSWHVESDVTDLSTLLKTAQTGEANLGNFVGVSGGVTYNGLIYANAQLEFYQAPSQAEAPKVPDVVIGLQGDSDGTFLNTTTDQLSKTLTLSTNIESVYLDVIAQSQSNDEFWFFCVPNDEASALESCGNTGFRETEVSIDGQPAGVAPVYPWVYTGGGDPYLWEPTPGVQTLDFEPYRVDLTPFAGVLSNGQQHTVAVSVFNADQGFSVTSTLLLFTDPWKAKITGGILSNDLAAQPTPTVTEDITTAASGNAVGTVTVASTRKFAISGYVNTSHGRVVTTVNQSMDFLSTQTFNVGGLTDMQDLVQSTNVKARTTTREGPFVSETVKTFSYPFVFNYNQAENADGSVSIPVSADQKLLTTEKKSFEGFEYFSEKVSEQVKSEDTLNYDSSLNFSGHTGSSSKASFATDNSLGYCYSRKLTSENNALTKVIDGKRCDDHGRDNDRAHDRESDQQ